MQFLILSIVTAAVLFIVLGFRKIGTTTTWSLSRRQIVAVLGAVWLLVGMVAVVPTGHTGILTTFGRVENTTLEAGLHFKSPFQEVFVMDNRNQKAVINMEAFSSDIQEVELTYSLNYQINKENAQTIYKEIGTDYYAIVMEPRIQEAVKSVIARYTAELLVENRDKLSQEIRVILKDSLSAYNIEVIDASLENMDFSDAFTDAVEAKQVAAQNKLQAEIQQEQKTMEQSAQAERAKIQAEAEAEVAKIQAEADLEVNKIQADAAEYAGQKDAAVNKALSESLTEALLEYYKVKQWNGELPEYFVSGTDTVLPILGSLETTDPVAEP